jgi:hypothetical protein
MWYSMWDAEKDDDDAFERRLDSVVREIGDRGKVMLPEAVPPFREPTPAPAPAPALAPAPAVAPAVAPVPTAATAPASVAQPTTPSVDTRHFTPSAQQLQQASPGGTYPLVLHPSTVSTGGATAAGSFDTMAAFLNGQQDKFVELLREERDEVTKQRDALESKLEEQRRESEAKAEQLRQEMNRQRQQSETKADQLRRESEAKAEQLRQQSQTTAEQLRQEIEQLRAETAARPPLAMNMIDEEQLAALQSRLQSMHGAKLLTDDELFSLEDMIVDCIEVMPTAGASAVEVEKVAKMLLVSSKVQSDSTLSRQLRRKLL